MNTICKKPNFREFGIFLCLNSGLRIDMEPRTIREYYNNFLLKLGIQPINFHCLRHTFATRCIENGANYKTVSELLGHSSINTTLNLYVHPPFSEKRKCVELIQ